MTGPVLLFTLPPACGNGHPRGPGKILAGWRPCSDCQAALTGNLGHSTVRCLVAGCGDVWLSPPHEKAGTPGT